MTTTTDQTTAALRALTDRVELEDLVSRLGRWLDEGRWAHAAEVLADDVAVTTPGGTAAGIAAVTEQARRNHSGHTTQHGIGNVLAEVDGDHAAISANLVVRFAPLGPPAPPTFELGERYRLTAARTAAGWRLTSIALEPLWQRGERPPRTA